MKHPVKRERQPAGDGGQLHARDEAGKQLGPAGGYWDAVKLLSWGFGVGWGGVRLWLLGFVGELLGLGWGEVGWFSLEVRKSMGDQGV